MPSLGARIQSRPWHATCILQGMNDSSLTDADGTYLRRAIELSAVARARGNRPFGAIIVASDGEVLGEAWNATGESGDCTAHAETAAIRLASPKHPRERFADATIYASGEPCVMCAGAIFWCNIGRVVFGIDAVSLRGFRGERAEQRDAELSCRDVFTASPHAIECIGPALLHEASQPHVGFWKS
jgi:tRNA(adenine34) deaminase